MPAGDTPSRSVLVIAQELLWIIRKLMSGLLDKVDIIHLAGWSWYAPILCIAAKRRRIPIIRELTSQGDTGHIGGLGRLLILFTNRMASRFIAISPALGNMLLANLPGSNVWVRPNGVDVERFRMPSLDERGKARAAIGDLLPDLTESDIVVLSVARIRPLKNQVFLAECIKSLPPPYKVLFVGPAYDQDDAYLGQLKATLEQDGLATRSAILEGMHKDVRPFYWAADVLAFPSTNEGLGNVMLEALCCGVPVTANRIPGVTDWVVTEGENGTLSGLSVPEFSEALVGASELANRNAISLAAHARFDQTTIDNDYRSVISETVKS